MKKLLILVGAATCAAWSWPDMAYTRTEAESKELLKSIILRFHYSCPEVKTYEPMVGSDSELLIMCGGPNEEYGNRDMGYVLDVAGDDHVRKVKIAPSTFWEWLEDWF